MSTTFLFAGGGTGGHLYPGLAIAEHFASVAGSDADAHFICSTRPLDAEILKAETAAFTPIDAAPFGMSPGRLLKFLPAWGKSVKQASAIIRDASGRGSVHLVAMGGFVAAPAVQAARKLNVPVTLVNLDATPGLANNWIAKRAQRVLTALPVPGKHWTVAGPIVRREALPPADAPTCRRQLGLDPLKPTLLVTGASQGASSINQAMVKLVTDRPAHLAGWQVLHQTGNRDTDEVRKAYDRADIPAVVEPFVRQMGVWWGAADAAISRSGAGSVAEVWASRVPTIFMPYPYHKDQHQKANAMPLVEAGGAILLEDRIDAGANAAPLATTLVGFIRNPSRLLAMRASFEKLGPADGAARVAAALMGVERPTNRVRPLAA
jgi:UDP-N-acetylglucosamine--N-acetylmuramyl-(pentapeptide) pyrophosphoryl-undecaprenol N-acetylglucosamine transferase